MVITRVLCRNSFSTHNTRYFHSVLKIETFLNLLVPAKLNLEHVDCQPCGPMISWKSIMSIRLNHEQIDTWSSLKPTRSWASWFWIRSRSQAGGFSIFLPTESRGDLFTILFDLKQSIANSAESQATELSIEINSVLLLIPRNLNPLDLYSRLSFPFPWITILMLQIIRPMSLNRK